MVQSKAPTVAAYLKELPPDRRKEITAVRRMVRAHLPKGYRETMRYGMIAYEVPLTLFAETYNGLPLCYAALAAQKGRNTLYLMGPYTRPAQLTALRKAFATAGKRLNMGQSCIHFKTADDLPLDGLGPIVAGVTPDEYVRRYKEARAASRPPRAKKR